MVVQKIRGPFGHPTWSLQSVFLFPLLDEWPVYLFWNVARSDTPSEKSGPKAPVISVVKKNWLRLRLSAFVRHRRVCPRSSSEKWSERVLWSADVPKTWSASFLGSFPVPKNGRLNFPALLLCQNMVAVFRCVKKSTVAVVKKKNVRPNGRLFWRLQPTSKKKGLFLIVATKSSKAIQNVNTWSKHGQNMVGRSIFCQTYVPIGPQKISKMVAEMVGCFWGQKNGRIFSTLSLCQKMVVEFRCPQNMVTVFRWSPRLCVSVCVGRCLSLCICLCLCTDTDTHIPGKDALANRQGEDKKTLCGDHVRWPYSGTTLCGDHVRWPRKGTSARRNKATTLCRA